MLTNVSTLRVFTGFFFNTQATTWFTELGMFCVVFLLYDRLFVLMGFLGPINFLGYVSLANVVVAGIGIPLFFFYGKTMRRWTSGKVKNNRAVQQKWAGDEP